MTAETAIDDGTIAGSRPFLRPREITDILAPVELRAVRELVDRVVEGVDAHLVEAALFGSRARGDARPDSDIDVLLVFASLPLDREPQASQAERLSAEVSRRHRLPVTVWCVSLPDLEIGWRTPMLVDALEDSVPIWCRPEPLHPLPFTPPDALRCVGCLLARVAEGSDEFEAERAAGHWDAAARRARDDIVRLCTALLLLRGLTRPRRGDAARAVMAFDFAEGAESPSCERMLAWTAESFGPDGRDDQYPLRFPPGGFDALCEAIDYLHERVGTAERRLRRSMMRGIPLARMVPRSWTPPPQARRMSRAGPPAWLHP